MIRIAGEFSNNAFVRFLNSRGLGLHDVEIVRNSSGLLTAIYDDGVAPEIIDATAGAVGEAYGEDTNIPLLGSVIELQAKRTTVLGEVVGAGAQVFAGVLANFPYVIPRSVVLTDSGGVAPELVDDGLGFLIRSIDHTPRGTINYATGAVAVNYHFDEVPTGNVLADYEYSDLPDTGDVPTLALLSTLVIRLVSGAAVTTITWTIYEDSAATQPIAQGTDAISPASPFVIVDLDDRPSHCLDLSIRTSRWIKIIPDNATNDFQIRLGWKRG